MPIDLPTPHLRYGAWSGPKLLAAFAAGTGVVSAAVLVWTLPLPLVLPAVGLLTIAAAIAVAAIAWTTAHRRRPVAPFTYWDVAGALTFIGVCAALLSDAELALPLLESQRTE